MKFSTLTAAAALALASLAAPALAQDGVAVGATIYGSDGAPVGTVERVDGDTVTVNTGTTTAALPASTLGKGDNGPVIGWTKAELEAAVAEANREAADKLAAALVEGAEVYSSDNVRLGTINEFDPAVRRIVDAIQVSPSDPRELAERLAWRKRRVKT